MSAGLRVRRAIVQDVPAIEDLLGEDGLAKFGGVHVPSVVCVFFRGLYAQ
jgi:hypothetical protein